MCRTALNALGDVHQIRKTADSQGGGMKTPLDETYDALVTNWSKTHQYMLCGFRDDMGDIAQWVAYCTHNQPVTHSFYNRMQCNAVILPFFSDEQVLAAIEGLPDGDVKRRLLEGQGAWRGETA